jgi:RNA 2',3'-cyclic 3'-phosphodiesterase
MPAASQRWLYLMGKPPPAALARIMALPRYGGRAAELAHVTLLPFADLAREPANFVPRLLETMRGFKEDAFHIGFNRIAEGRCVILCARRVQNAAGVFQDRLVGFLEQRGFAAFQVPPKVHLTINYRRDGRGGEAIEPIAWCMDEVLLIESVYGQARHVMHGRWPLSPLLI